MSLLRFAFIGPGGIVRRLDAEAGGAARRLRRVLVVPGSDVSAAWIEAAGSTPAQRRAAALAELGPRLALAPADAAVALGPRGAGGGRQLVCVAARAQLAGWLASARAAGFDPELVTPDFALIAAPPPGEARIARDGGDVIVRGHELAFRSQAELAPMLLAGASLAETDLYAEASRAARTGLVAAAPDFAAAASGAASPRLVGAAVRGAAALVVALAIAAATPWIDVARLNHAAAEQRRAQIELARAALPGAERIVDPRAQLAQAALDLDAGSAGVQLLERAVGAIAAAPTAIVDRATVDAARGVVIEARVLAPEDLDGLRALAAAESLALRETLGLTEEGRTAVQIDIEAAP
jgi:type II secretory pathway component PulL